MTTPSLEVATIAFISTAAGVGIVGANKGLKADKLGVICTFFGAWVVSGHLVGLLRIA